MKPRVFIGSSSEGKSVGLSLQSGLENDAEVTVWTQDVFRPSEFILESLLKQLAATDMGIFVFSADDVVRMRGAEHAAARDNVIFEFGLYVGRLGRECSVIVVPKGDDLRLPSDLLGINTLKYDSRRQDGNLEAALGPACHSIQRLLSHLPAKDSGAVPRDLALGFIERRDQLSAKQRALLSAIEARDRSTEQDIGASFPEFTVAELHYRLEHLRLLAFIEAAHGSAPDQDAEYTLTAAYRAALGKVRRVNPGYGPRT